MSKIVFFGTQEWAATLLEAIIRDGFFEIPLVVTQPDQILGRDKILTPTPVKKVALAYGLSVTTPTKLRDPLFLDQLKDSKADIGLVIAYGRILPSEVLTTPTLGTLNVHPSLLPTWRGPSPIQSAIANGDTVSGMTIMKIDEQMDHGPVLVQEKIRIDESETYDSFMKKVLDIAPALLIETLKKFVHGEITAQDQNHEQATTCPMLTRDSGRINWKKSADEIERMVRAFQSWPGTWTEFEHRGKLQRLKILQTQQSLFPFPRPTASPGTLVTSQHQLFVTTGDGMLELLILQPEGKAPMTAQAFLSGYAAALGSVLKS